MTAVMAPVLSSLSGVAIEHRRATPGAGSAARLDLRTPPPDPPGRPTVAALSPIRPIPRARSRSYRLGYAYRLPADRGPGRLVRADRSRATAAPAAARAAGVFLRLRAQRA